MQSSCVPYTQSALLVTFYMSGIFVTVSESIFIKNYLYFISMTPIFKKGFPGNSDGKKSACNAGDSGSIPG